MRRALPAFLIWISVLSEAQNLGFTLSGGRKKVEIPIEVSNNLIIVPVILNDALPLKFIVDTGVRTTILTQKSFSDILQLEYARKYTFPGPGGERFFDAYVTNNVSLRLPGVEGRGHAMLVLEEDYLELRNYLGTDVHGILGYELFSRFIVAFDYQQKTMTLMLPEKFKPSKKFKVIPVRIQDTKPYFLAPISISGGHTLNAKLLIDTGASHGLMLERDSDPRIVLPEKTVNSIIGRGLGGVITGKIGRIESIEIGNFKLTKVLVNFPDSNTYFLDTLRSHRIDRNGTLGGEILSRFKVVFNFPQEKIYLKKTVDVKKEFYFNLSGLNLRAKGSALSAFEVSEVRPSSPGALAGIQVGDNILTVNGLKASDFRLNHLNAIFNSKPGKRIKVEVDRKGERLSFEFKLENQI